MPPKAKGKTGKARAHHARGLEALEQGDLEGAAAAFRASLAAQAKGPASADAAKRLEEVERQLAPPARQQQPGNAPLAADGARAGWVHRKAGLWDCWPRWWLAAVALAVTVSGVHTPRHQQRRPRCQRRRSRPRQQETPIQHRRRSV